MQKRKKQKINTTTRITAVIMVIILVVGATYGILAYIKKQANPFKWFDEEKTAVAEPIGTMMLEFDKNVDAPMKIGYTKTKTAINTISDPNQVNGNSIEVTVTTNPIDASIQTVTWGVAWTSSNDSWANGKNAMDYIQIQPSEEDSKNATITCLQPFGATITIICTSDDKEDGTISATCKAQYAKRITGGTISLTTDYWYEDEDDSDNSTYNIIYEKTFVSSDRESNSSIDYTLNIKKEGNYPQWSSYYVFSPTSGVGTKKELASTNKNNFISTEIYSSNSYRGGSNNNPDNLKLVFRIRADKKQAIESATGLTLTNYEYLMDGANINVKEAFAQFFGGQSNIENKRIAIYNCLQKYCELNEKAFEFYLTFTGISGTKYELSFPLNVNCSALRTPVQELPGLDDEYIF